MDRSKDRRCHARFPLSLRATARALGSYAPSSASSASVAAASIEDISEGGLGLVTDCELPVSALVECWIFFPSIPIPIPTLLTVRWSRKRRSGPNRDVGLQFLV